MARAPGAGAVTASAPGKVLLHGEHSVVFGHRALAACLGLRTATTVARRPAAAPRVRLRLPAVALDARVPAAALWRAARDAGAAWRHPRRLDHERLLRAVDELLAPRAAAWGGAQRDAARALLYLAAAVLADAPDGPGALRVSVRSELAVGAGAGSSAALAVSAAAALLRLRAGAAADARLVSAWAFSCERIAHGAPSGVDNAASAFGGLVAFRRGEEPRALALRVRLRVLLVDTRAARRTSAQVARVAERRARWPAAVDATLQACGHVADAALEVLQQLSDAPGGSGEQYAALGELWDANHCLLAALGVSHRALEHVRALAAEHGLAAKLTGAGGGGYAIVLVPPAADAARVRALRDALEAAGYLVTDTLLGGDGVRVHDTPDESDEPDESDKSDEPDEPVALEATDS